MDFNEALQNRRLIFDRIEECQQQEHDALKRVGERAVRGKEELLVLLSDWLLSLKTMPTSATVTLDWQGLTTISLREWVTLQQEVNSLENNLAEARAEESRRDEVYRGVATLGFVTEAFAYFDDQQKLALIQALKGDLARARSHRENVDTQVAHNTSQRQELGERFLRDCVTNLDVLMTTSTFGLRATRIVQDMAGEMNRLWTDHASTQTYALDSIAEAVKSLRSAYNIKATPGLASYPAGATTNPVMPLHPKPYTPKYRRSTGTTLEPSADRKCVQCGALKSTWADSKNNRCSKCGRSYETNLLLSSGTTPATSAHPYTLTLERGKRHHISGREANVQLPRVILPHMASQNTLIWSEASGECWIKREAGATIYMNNHPCSVHRFSAGDVLQIGTHKWDFIQHGNSAELRCHG